MAKFGVKQSDFSKGLTVTGSLVISGSQIITGSVISTFGFTGSLQGTAATASAAPDYTLTSSFLSASASFDSRIAATSASLVTLSGSLIVTSGSFDARISSNSASISALSESFEELSGSFVNLNLSQITSGSYTASIGANGFQVNTSASISGSLNVQGTITATTLIVQTITSSQELVTGSLIVSGTLFAPGGITGSLFGTSSYASNALTSSYTFNAVSASYAATTSFLNTLSQSVIISGSLDLYSNTNSGFVSNADTLLFVGTSSFSGLTSFTSSIIIENQTNPTSLFLIKSGSTTYLNVSSSGNAELYSNLFIIRNFTTQQPVLTVSQSIVQFATQSSNPTGTAPNGGIWFTSASMYVGLD